MMGPIKITKKINIVLKCFFEVIMQAIKIAFFFGNCGSHQYVYNLSNCQKRKFCFKIVLE